MEFNYLYGKQAEQFAYVNIPKALIHEEAFSDVSLEAKMLYGLIMERMGMYRKNKWQDEQGRVYVFYLVKEIMICRSLRGNLYYKERLGRKNATSLSV